VIEKFNTLPGLPFFDKHSYDARHPSVEKTWESRINPTLFQQMQMGQLKIIQSDNEPFRMQREDEKPRMKKAVGIGY